MSTARYSGLKELLLLTMVWPENMVPYDKQTEYVSEDDEDIRFVEW